MALAVDDQRPNQSLADDPAFLASLDVLDDGLGASRASPENRAAPATELPPAPREAPTPAPESPRRHSVLELFPPPDLQPVPRARRPDSRRSAPAVAALRAAAPNRYLTFYGLDEEPFAAAPDPRFFYHSGTHDDAVQELLTAIRRREGVVLVTGPDGAGKTIVCRTAIEHLDRRTLTCVVPPADTFDDLMRSALVGFGVIAPEELAVRQPPLAELLVTMREFLLSLAGLQAFAVLFVDDAGRMPVEALRELAALADTGADQRLLEIVLVGDAGLVRALGRGDMKPLARQITVRCTVGPLTGEDLRGYVAHRLAVAGPNPRVEIREDAFDRLTVLSGGLPRMVNVLCDRALDAGASAGAAALDAEAIDRAASELGVDAPESPVAGLVRGAAVAAMLAGMMAVGASAAALIFHERIDAAVRAWQQAPAPPHAPVIPRARPLSAVPFPDPAVVPTDGRLPPER